MRKLTQKQMDANAKVILLCTVSIAWALIIFLIAIHLFGGSK